MSEKLKRVLRVIPGIGSNTTHRYDAEVVLKKVAAEVAQQAPAIEFINSAGWRLIAKRYKSDIINEMKHRIIYLSTQAEKNKDEIQHTSNIIGACELLLGLTDKIITAHQEALKTHNTIKGTAGGER
jgi:hypothetical protein